MDTITNTKKSLKPTSKPSRSQQEQKTFSATETSHSQPTIVSTTPPVAPTQQQGNRRICSGCGGKKAQHATLCKTCYSNTKAKSNIELICNHCGERFTREKAEHQKSIDRHGSDVRTFCCRACYDGYKREHPLSYSKVKGQCKHCSKPIVGHGKSKFCSFDCYSVHRAKQRQVEPYNGKFLALKSKVAFRDKDCQMCGADSGARFETHHVDFDAGNNTLENLILLCTACHRKYHQLSEPVQTVLQTYFKSKIML